MIVWLLHGCKLEVMRNLVRIIRDANVPVAHKGASKSKTVPLREEHLKVLLIIALNHSPLQQS